MIKNQRVETILKRMKEEHEMKKANGTITPIQNYQITYEMKHNAIKERFPNAEFVISCFETIDEIENKVLNYYNDNIIIIDNPVYDIDNRIKCTKKNVKYERAQDYYVVMRKPHKKHIYYCDVIDELIRNKLCRNHCDHRYLESISLSLPLRNNMNSTPVYCFFWGS